jgi:hypothetical protein
MPRDFFLLWQLRTTTTYAWASFQVFSLLGVCSTFLRGLLEYDMSKINCSKSSYFWQGCYNCNLCCVQTDAKNFKISWQNSEIAGLKENFVDLSHHRYNYNTTIHKTKIHKTCNACTGEDEVSSQQLCLNKLFPEWC